MCYIFKSVKADVQSMERPHSVRFIFREGPASACVELLGHSAGRRLSPSFRGGFGVEALAGVGIYVGVSRSTGNGSTARRARRGRRPSTARRCPTSSLAHLGASWAWRLPALKRLGRKRPLEEHATVGLCVVVDLALTAVGEPLFETIKTTRRVQIKLDEGTYHGVAHRVHTVAYYKSCPEYRILAVNNVSVSVPVGIAVPYARPEPPRRCLLRPAVASETAARSHTRSGSSRRTSSSSEG